MNEAIRNEARQSRVPEGMTSEQYRKLVRMRTEYLNNINTQSTLLAACSVAMLGSSELQAFTEVGNRRRPVDEYDRIEMDLWSWIFAVQYVVSGATCLSASVWVIYTAMNLINLSIHSTLYGKSMAELADNLVGPAFQPVRVALASCGHPVDKIELLVLGGTWTSYPEARAVSLRGGSRGVRRALK